MDARTLAVIKHKCETDFLFFVRYFFKVTTGQKFTVNHHHKTISDSMLKCTTGEILRLIVNMPPRYGKTELVVKMFIAWCIAKNPKAKFIHLSYSDELAFDNSSAIKEIILCDEFKELWPEIVLKDDAKSKKKWYTREGGGLYAVSSGGAVTGFGAGSTADGAQDEDGPTVEDIEELRALGVELDWLSEEKPDDGLFYGAIIIDDPIKPSDASSAVVRKTINSRMVSTIGSRVNSRRTPIIVVMQRLHEDDPSGFLLGGGTGEKWTHLSLPALIEHEDGTEEALWPWKHTVPELKKMRDADSYVFSGQYQQTPTPAKGGLIDTDWFPRYNTLPAEFDQILISCDTAFKAAAHNDPSVALVAGKKGNKWYIIEIWRERVTYPNLKRAIYALNDKYRPEGILVEDKASGQSLLQDMKEDGVPGIRINPEADKLTRMSSQAPLVESGLVYLPERAEWLYEFVQEALHFPLSKHDDQIDALSQLLKYIRKAIELWTVGGDEYDTVEDDDDWDDDDEWDD